MADLAPVFTALRAVMAPQVRKLRVKTDTDTSFYVETDHVQKNGKQMFFGAVMLKKNYVSYHLMPVYVDPSLLKGISPQLRQRMQGKSCFNFTRVDKALFRELRTLTKAGLDSFRERGLA